VLEGRRLVVGWWLRFRWWWPGRVHGRAVQDPRVVAAEPLVDLGVGVVVGVVGGVGVGQIGTNGSPRVQYTRPSGLTHRNSPLRKTDAQRLLVPS
jgi:hypothetical protein